MTHFNDHATETWFSDDGRQSRRLIRDQRASMSCSRGGGVRTEGGFPEGLSRRLVHHVTHHHPALNRTWKKKIPRVINESWWLSDGCGNGRVSCQSNPTSQTSKSLFTVTDSQAAPGFCSQTRQPLGFGLGIACVYVCCRDGLGAVALLTLTDLQQLCSDNARCCC